MLSFLKKKTPTSPSTIYDLQSTTLSLSGLHCSSCAVDIDLALEELPSVESTTNYQKSETKVTYNPKETSLAKIKSTISDLGYQITSTLTL